ncbi:uncharacterized protein ASCRUDRAFT_74309 [Ascoidea rubescens DSM 1968]|uniref:Uncharacterized protein n=1 Tax=Ascoidea rubescens DSM 1968 TaxID=1344418 RepID=A0A1D2VML5_9ASCO|nr:hypothetical protein ASCRUDRAFT_74309 [Ascoidea rubescens DSM 1968]ODV62852.1 hypothetical protein ASCRUDRAFT_74309 [Ascoidea rubescens DSM 1968]
MVSKSDIKPAATWRLEKAKQRMLKLQQQKKKAAEAANHSSDLQFHSPNNDISPQIDNNNIIDSQIHSESEDELSNPNLRRSVHKETLDSLTSSASSLISSFTHSDEFTFTDSKINSNSTCSSVSLNSYYDSTVAGSTSSVSTYSSSTTDSFNNEYSIGLLTNNISNTNTNNVNSNNNNTNNNNHSSFSSISNHNSITKSLGSSSSASHENVVKPLIVRNNRSIMGFEEQLISYP